MPDYFVFGGCLRSDLAFDELSPTTGREPDWTLRVARLAPDADAEIISDAVLSRNCHIRITKTAGTFRYDHSCTGVFEVSADGRNITFDPGEDADLNAARTDFVSRVLLYCVNRCGVTWLHGSAVQIGSSAVAFLGPSGAGKSTIALALARGGAAHICDDTLPVETGSTPMIWPSDHVIRLRPDSREFLAVDADAIRRESDGKFVLTQGATCIDRDKTDAHRTTNAHVPLRALYLLSPITSERMRFSAVPAERRFLPPRAALPKLMQHIKLGPLIRPGDPAHYMQQIGAIVRSVPIFELRLPRDWTRLEHVVNQLLDWHSAPGLLNESVTPDRVTA